MSAKNRIELRLLGPLEVLRDGKPVNLGGAKPRALLCNLALHLGHVLSSDRLIDDLWSGTPPRTSSHALQVYVSKLRTVLDPEKTGLIAARPPGYALELAPAVVDIHRFERLVEEGRDALRTGDPSSASSSLREALALWRGAALADFLYDSFTQADIARLEDMRTAVRQDLIDVELELRPSSDLLPEIEALVASHSFAERPRAQLMLALYRAGRQADALAAYREARRTLVEELGVEPSAALRELEHAILRQDSSLDRPNAAWPFEERRKTVTVLFADLVGSTGLADEHDPEVWHRLQERLFATLRAAIKRHGGTVERVIGDAVMAIFGVPRAREDDALRAVRAALAMRTGISVLNDELERELRPRLALRIGINTGEVFAGGPAGGPLVSGSVVNLARRLEEAALPGEILVGAGTLALTRHAVTTEQLRARRRGEEEPVPAFLLVEVMEGAPAIARYLRAPLVGRDEELGALRKAFEDARTESRCRLVTLLGEPGIGKTRLANELVASLDDEATVLVGRCVPYGEGATYLSLTEMIEQVDLEATVADEDEGELVARRVRELIGASEASGSSEDGFWAVRRLCEALARECPLVLLFEDLHWGEPTLLDLVEHLHGRAEGPILLLSVSRPELLEKRPSWAKTSLSLAPLPQEQAEVLVVALPRGQELPQDVRTRILETAEGNPLFVEQLFAHVQETGTEGLRTIPPTITLLLAARLDRLPDEERVVLERASIEGTTFHREAVVELAPDRARPRIGEVLTALVAKGLIQPERPAREAEMLRFHHQLVRNAAYEALAKLARAQLHEQLANWLESHTATPDEVVGYHLEQAFRYLSEQLPADERSRELGARAAGMLKKAGRRASAVGDAPASVSLLRRADALVQAVNGDRVELLLELYPPLMEIAELGEADALLAEAAALASRAGNRGAEMHAIAARLWIRIETDHPRVLAEEMTNLARRAIETCEAAEDDRGLGRAWGLMSAAHFQVGCYRAAGGAIERALAYARSAGDRRRELELLYSLARSLWEGPTPVVEGLDRCRQTLEEVRESPATKARLQSVVGGFTAMQGRFEEARAMLTQAERIFEELGRTRDAAAVAGFMGPVELWAGDAVAAERAMRSTCNALEVRGEKASLSAAAVCLSEALYLRERYDEAEHWIRVSQQAAPRDSYSVQSHSRAVQAKILARRSAFAQAEQLAREAVSIVKKTDGLNNHGDVILGLAEVLRLSDRRKEAVSTTEDALDLYTQKGNTASVGKTCKLLQELRGA